MAKFIKCPECGAQISAKAKACPHCGVSLKKKPGCLTWFLALLVFISLVGSCSGGDDKAPTTEVTPSATSAAQSAVPSAESAAAPEAQEAYEIISKKATTWVNSIGTTWVQTIIEVENTGSENLFLGSCSYDLEDASGNLVAVHDLVSAYPNVLAPGEKGIIYHETTLDAAVDGELTVLPHEDIKAATVDLIRYPISDFSLSADKYSGINMLGRVENNTDEEISLVYICAILYDADGSCIGSIFTIVEKVPAGEKMGFEASSFSMPDSITVDDVASYEVYAYPLQFQF